MNETILPACTRLIYNEGRRRRTASPECLLDDEMKRFAAMLMSLLLCVSMSACSAPAQDDDAGTAEPSTTENTQDTGGQNVLVVYYSATGNTESVANDIAAALDADVFELEPVDPYTEEDLNGTDDNSRVVAEYENEDERDVELVNTSVDNWEEIDTVFIGYPIWWGIAAWPVNQFIENNDFTGKTVIPFCTSSSSGLGESGELLAQMAGTGDWQEGMRFRSGVDEADVQEWVNGLGL